MKRNIPYQELEKHYTAPKVISPFYGDIRLPRELKKKVKKYCGVHWGLFTPGQCLWSYMDKVNPNYKTFLLKKICE